MPMGGMVGSNAKPGRGEWLGDESRFWGAPGTPAAPHAPLSRAGQALPPLASAEVENVTQNVTIKVKTNPMR